MVEIYDSMWYNFIKGLIYFLEFNFLPQRSCKDWSVSNARTNNIKND